MARDGYIYVLLRSDFIEQQTYVYKIGETTRDPPHKRLWDYPYGSIFLCLVKTHKPTQFEKLLKKKLAKSPKVTCLKKIGVEYFEGSLSEIIDLINNIYPIYNPSQKLTLTPINENYLLQLNRVHYLVNYEPSFFEPLYQYHVCSTNERIPSEKIYETYQQFRRWHAEGYPDNYVIRCGMTSIKPSQTIKYHVKITA